MYLSYLIPGPTCIFDAIYKKHKNSRRFKAEEKRSEYLEIIGFLTLMTPDHVRQLVLFNIITSPKTTFLRYPCIETFCPRIKLSWQH